MTMNRNQYPCVEFDLDKLAANLAALVERCHDSLIEVAGVVKAVSSLPEIVRVYEESGVKFIATSRISQMRKIREAGLNKKPLMLIRIPMLSELSEVVEPAILAFDHYREEVSARIFPVGTQEYLALRLARDIVRFLTEGVKQQDSIRIDREARIHALKAFLRELGTTQQGTDLIRKVVDDIAAARDAAGDGDGDG